MATEDIDPRFADLDLWDNASALNALYEAQVAAVAALGPALPAIKAAVEAGVPRLARGGRLIYVGAGTSARIGVQDGAELAPTFNWPHEKLAFVIAGGEGALLRAVENAEDSREDGAARVAALNVGADDVVIGLAASGATPFTVAAIEAARARDALTIGIANSAGSPLLSVSEHAVLLDTGAEPIAGSTRLGAGTAQKVALNLFSTLVMVRMGRVYGGLMVHMRASNAKLRRRGAGMVARIVGCGEADAESAMRAADGDVKLAVLVARGLSREAGEAALAKHAGNLRDALGEVAPR